MDLRKWKEMVGVRTEPRSRQLSVAEMPLYRYYLTHPLPIVQWDKFKTSLPKMDSTLPWRIKTSA
jgi:hypothetical protein